MDVVPTLLKRWLNCGDNATKLTAGDDLFKIKRDRVIANTVDNGMVVFNKDKFSTFIYILNLTRIVHHLFKGIIKLSTMSYLFTGMLA